MPSLGRITLVAFALSLAVCGAASAQGNSRITDRGEASPDGAFWLQVPSWEDVRYAYPPEAKKAKVGGAAVISCEATSVGRLANCAVVTETPDGAGFGAAAVKLGGKFRMKSRGADKLPVAGREFTIPITFAMIATDLEFGEPAIKGDPVSDSAVSRQ